MITFKNFLVCVIVAICFVVSGCGDSRVKETGSQAESEAEALTLQQIYSSPGKYDNEFVELKGNFSNMCCQGCFTYKEGIESIEIVTDVKGWETFKPGTPVTIRGVLRVREKTNGDGTKEVMTHVEAKEVIKR